MPLYESVFIARQDISNSQVEALTDSFASVIEEGGGQVAKRESWGLRSLAYRINKNRKGHYVLFNIDAPSDAIQEMERQMRLNEDILRYLTIKIDELEEGPSMMMQRSGRDDRGRRDDRRDRGDRGGRGDRPRRDDAAADAGDEAKTADEDEAKAAGEDAAKAAGEDAAKAAGEDEAKAAGEDEAKAADGDDAKDSVADGDATDAGSTEEKEETGEKS